MTDRIEFYTGPKEPCLTSIDSSIVPPVGSFISIMKQTYRVERVTYALDYADHSRSLRQMRVNVDLKGPTK